MKAYLPGDYLVMLAQMIILQASDSDKQQGREHYERQAKELEFFESMLSLETRFAQGFWEAYQKLPERSTLVGYDRAYKFAHEIDLPARTAEVERRKKLVEQQRRQVELADGFHSRTFDGLSTLWQKRQLKIDTLGRHDTIAGVLDLVDRGLSRSPGRPMARALERLKPRLAARLVALDERLAELADVMADEATGYPRMPQEPAGDPQARQTGSLDQSPKTTPCRRRATPRLRTPRGGSAALRRSLGSTRGCSVIGRPIKKEKRGKNPTTTRRGAPTDSGVSGSAAREASGPPWEVNP